MKIKLILILFLFSCLSCKSRKVQLDKHTFSDQSVITAETSSNTELIDTGSTVSNKFQLKASKTDSWMKIYPKNGIPFTITGDHTFTGEADSIITGKEVESKEQKQEIKDEKKALKKTSGKVTKTKTQNKIKAAEKEKVVVSGPNPTLVLLFAVIIALTGIVLFACYALRKKDQQ